MAQRFTETFERLIEQRERDRPIIWERVRRRVALSTAAVLAPTTAYGPRKL